MSEERPYMTTLDLLKSFPSIPWREPLLVSRDDLPETQHYTCRICMAQKGLRGQDVPRLPKTPEEVVEHIHAAHPELWQ
jgi:hypothetical protein